MKQYRLLRDILNYSTGSVVPKGEIFEQTFNGLYYSNNGWMMSKEAVEKKDWFEEVNTVDGGNNNDIEKYERLAFNAAKCGIRIPCYYMGDKRNMPINDITPVNTFEEYKNHEKYKKYTNQESPTNTVEDKPLFVTEDGVEINKSSDVVLHHVSPNFDLSWSGSRYLSKQDRSDLKIFRIREKAEEYILLNKPFMSIQDVMNRLGSGYLGRNADEAFENLKHFAKTNNQ